MIDEVELEERDRWRRIRSAEDAFVLWPHSDSPHEYSIERRAFLAGWSQALLEKGGND